MVAKIEEFLSTKTHGKKYNCLAFHTEKTYAKFAIVPRDEMAFFSFFWN